MSVIEFLEYYSDHIKVREATKQGYAIARGGDSVNLEQPNSKTRRGRVGKGYANTLTCGCNQGVVIEEGIMNQIITVGNYSPSNHNASRVVSIEGLAPTVMENHGTVTAILNKTNKLKGESEGMWRNELEKFEFKMDEVRIFDIFAGIGSLHKNLTKLGVPNRITNLSEVDIDAIISYSGIHIDNFKDMEFNYPPDEYMREWLMGRNIGFDFDKGKSKIPRLNKDKLKLLYRGSYLLKNLGDVSQINPDEIEDFDLMNLSFCCQDLSNAGKQKGLKNEDGTPTRSGLIVPSLKLARAKKPKYIMIENVKALIQNKFIEDFYGIINELEDMGYVCYYPTKEDKKKGKVPTCLNSKNYGIPQNRERIFVFAVREDVDNGMEFNYGFDNGIRLKDILEESVDEKYYLSDEHIDKISQWTAYQRPFERVYGKESTSPTLTARGAGEYHSGMITCSDKLEDTTNCEKEGLDIHNLRIRKLTPLECWRLQGFDDEDFYKAKELGVSDSQLYKQAGNSITVNTMYYQFKNLFKQYIVEQTN